MKDFTLPNRTLLLVKIKKVIKYLHPSYKPTWRSWRHSVWLVISKYSLSRISKACWRWETGGKRFGSLNSRTTIQNYSSNWKFNCRAALHCNRSWMSCFRTKKDKKMYIHRKLTVWRSRSSNSKDKSQIRNRLSIWIRLFRHLSKAKLPNTS